MRKRMTQITGWGTILLVIALLTLSAPVLARPGLGQPVASSAMAGRASARLAAAVSQAVLPTTTCPLVSGVRTCDLWAMTGTIALPGAGAVPIWGLATSASGPAQLPGPALIVNQGEAVQVILHNVDISPAVGLVFPGQSLFPDTEGVAPGGSQTYDFTAANPGTYIYESGTDPEIQVAMGLYGALIVRSSTPGQAYGGSASAYEDEALLVLSEIDPNFNADPTGFNRVNYAPKFWMINGEVHPDTDTIQVAAGNRVLLRYVNAGLVHDTMSLLGAHQQVIAKDAYPAAFPYSVVAETIAAGSTADMIVNVPPTASLGTRLPLYNRQEHVINPVNQFPGGMLTFIEVTSPAQPVYGVAVTPPTASQSGNPGGTLIYNFNVTNTGNTSDSYTVAIAGNAWTTTAPATLGPVASGGTVPMAVNVEIPAGAANGSTDVVTVTVTSQGDNTKSDSSTITSTALSSIVLYLSLSEGGTVGSLTGVGDEDILSFNGSAFAMLFDGSDVGVDALDLDGFVLVDADTIWMSFDNPGTIGSLGTVDDSDIVQFDAATLGDNTAGAFSWAFDGSDVGLTTNAEDVDAIDRLPDGSLLVSTFGNPDIPGVAGEQDEDLLSCTGTFGATTSCTWSMYFDGSDVGLSAGSENVDAVDANGSIYLSTTGNFSVTGAAGADEDVFVCTAPTTGANTACTYSPTLFFDGSAWGLAANDVDEIKLP